ncbi:MAG: carbonic anhydrase [Candidatus Acidiferrales bacterium]
MSLLFDTASDDLQREESTPALKPCLERGPHATASNLASSRRSFFKMTVGGAVAGWATATGIEFAAPRRVMAQSALSPDAALQELMDGNRRFSTGNMTSWEHDLSILKQKTVDKQEPFAAVLSCADSRVPVELLFDQTIGHIFVTRVAGNFAATEIIASLEYGAAVLGTKVILVMAHSGCGAVKATIQAKEVPGQISALFSYIQPAVDQAGPNLEAASKANAKIQAAILRQSSTVISGLVKENKLKVVAGYYDLATGVVSLLE